MTSAAGATAYQAALYGAAKANSTTAALPVLTYTLGIGVNPAGFQVGGNADVDDRHCYGANTSSASATLAYCQTYAALASGAPQWMTEAGWTTGGGASAMVGETAQARLNGDFFLDAFAAGIKRVYEYDATNYGNDGYSGGAIVTGSTAFNSFYGAYKSNGWPKTLANLLHDLLYILTRSPAGGGTLTAPGTLSFVVSNLPANGHSLLLQQPGGVFDEILWTDQQFWDSTNNVDINPTPTNVTLTFASAQPSVVVFDPVVSPVPIQSATNATSITTALGGDPIVLEIQTVSGGGGI